MAVVNVAEDVKKFTNKVVNIELNENNFPLWKQQVFLTVKSYGLEGYLEGTQTIPAEFLIIDGEKQENQERVKYDHQDSALASWLLSIVSLDVRADLVSCNSASSIWAAIHRIFTAKSTTKIMNLRCSLHAQRKRDQGMREYLRQIKNICENLAICGEKISETEHISTIVNGLTPDFENAVTMITTSQQQYTVETVSQMLIDIENRKKAADPLPQFSANIASVSNPSVASVASSSNSRPAVSYVNNSQSVVPYASAYAPSSLYANAGYVVPQNDVSGNGNRGNGVSYPSVNGGWNQGVYQANNGVWNQNANAGYGVNNAGWNQNFNNNPGWNQSFQQQGQAGRGRGRGRYPNNNRPQCQLCRKVGHTVQRCYRRFDQSFSGYDDGEVNQGSNKTVQVNNCEYSEGNDSHYHHQQAVNSSVMNGQAIGQVSSSMSVPAQAQVSSAPPIQAMIATPHIVADNAWYPDSGASNHVTHDASGLAGTAPYTGQGSAM